jgi:HTH-type transcriptional repressor of NAD biosynthesis genes
MGMKTWCTGLVIGKFYPPHRGHRLLIETALSRCQTLHLIVCGKDGEVPNGDLRASWLREMFPSARVILIDDTFGRDDDSAYWAQLTVEWLGRAPDVVFTSEHYGEPYSKFLGCEHVCVDLSRGTVPISGTQVRAHPLAHWTFLDAPAHAFYAKRVVVLGAESSGTTTLASDLAAHFQTLWVPEYGREYCETHWAGWNYAWRSEEFAPIAGEQTRREELAARECNRVLICDTDAFATRLWHWRYFGTFSPEVDAIAAARKQPDLCLLTSPDIPFVQDGWRDGENIRAAMHLKFIEELNQQRVPWHLVRGGREARLRKAVELVERVLR